MSTLAEIEEAVETLPIEEQRKLLQHIAARLENTSARGGKRPEIRLLSKNLGIRPGIDPNKLGQIADDY